MTDALLGEVTLRQLALSVEIPCVPVKRIRLNGSEDLVDQIVIKEISNSRAGGDNLAYFIASSMSCISCSGVFAFPG